MNQKESNKEKHPEAWTFFKDQARNMEGTDEESLGKYRIPVPNLSGDFFYSDDPGELWGQFIVSWYKVDKNAHSVYGQIQFIVENFSH